ncbi:hypothetical protein [Streptomyces sp. NPDC055140]
MAKQAADLLAVGQQLRQAAIPVPDSATRTKPATSFPRGGRVIRVTGEVARVRQDWEPEDLIEVWTLLEGAPRSKSDNHHIVATCR